MKKGISLIVLVITIIVLAILAGAIIISLSNANIVEQANTAVNASDLANAKNAVTLEYAAAVARGYNAGKTDGKAYDASGSVMDATDYYTALNAAGFGTTATAAGTGFTVVVDNDSTDPDDQMGLPTSVTAYVAP